MEDCAMLQMAVADLDSSSVAQLAQMLTKKGLITVGGDDSAT